MKATGIPGIEYSEVLARSDLRGSNRATIETPPILRGELSGSSESALIEVPMVTTDQSQSVEVLHVDDEPSFTDLAKTYLERVDEHFSVTRVSTTVEALNQLEDADFDCIISDYEMPTTNGIEFLEIVRTQYPDLPFILYTGKGSEEVASEAIAAGVTDYMQKGSGTEQYEVLANRVRNAVEKYRAQEKFWDALTWYQRLVEQDLTGVFIIQDEEFVYVNERFADTFGYDQSDLIGTSPLSIAAGPDDSDVLTNVMDPTYCDDDTYRSAFTATRSDGSEVHVEIHGGSIQYDGEPGCIGVIWDHRK